MNLPDDFIIEHIWHDEISDVLWLKENKMKTNTPPYKAQIYDRFHKTYTLNEVLPFVSKTGKRLEKEFDGNLIKMFSLRLRTFLIHGAVCANCGLCGHFFALERQLFSSDKQRYHFNLYGTNEAGQEILFTKDHIIPKSKRGPNSVDNMQTLCIICNLDKGDSITIKK